ncbi:Glycoside hydrolase family 61 [Penicillium longicatenatum]|uniref:Glycoside hydrolase family 61 n=1 Tax=Penicillium longicatenatum TaxID=1561947 RepID=UPI0025490AFD|nr:Glycoside hydrolase family 61 [Penicillium longicatenatum]KAJ5661174.1 Glycoside hydrolase family 61 [Penicillium longicatenatum]
MKSFMLGASAFLTLLSQASAHYFFPYFIANGNFTGYYEYVREDTQGYMPVKNSYTQDLMRCNTGSEQYANRTSTYKVKAGDTIGFGLDFGATIQHPGPMQVYLSKAPGDVKDYDGSGDWFKVYELGPTSFGSGGITWGVTGIGNFTFTLPEVPAGQYLVRIEHIAVHGAGSYGDAEFYFNCAQIEVESESTVLPAPNVKIPGLYTGYEPGILFNMYSDCIVNYTMPGPRPFPDLAFPGVLASGVSVCPGASWTLPAVTRYPSASVLASSTSAVVITSTPLVSAHTVSTQAASADIVSEQAASTQPETTANAVATQAAVTGTVAAFTVTEKRLVTETVFVTVQATDDAACPVMHHGMHHGNH